MNSTIIMVLVGCLAVIPNSIFSQTCCTGGVPITGALRINTYPANSAQLRLIYDYNKIEDVYLDGNLTDDERIKRATKTLLLQADYVISKFVALSVLVPYIWTSEETDQLSQPLLLETNGIGDISLIGQFKIPVSQKYPLVVGGGMKFPTGETKKVNNSDGFILPANLQPGTGSFDAIFLISYQTPFSQRKSLQLTSSLFYRLNTSSDNLTFHDRYKFGNELQIFAGISDDYVVGSVITTPSLLFRLRNTQKDQIEDFDNDNTGGTWLYLVPGINLSITPKIILGFSAELPIYRNLNGFQITTSSKLVASIHINFSKNDTDIIQLDKQL
ncbi:MAG: transporter [Bacteroidetes bacterium]|nr:MAG: transporter [Bacteroidota bacterium]